MQEDVATLRRDGFCSLRAGREREEQVTTRLLTFRRRTLYVNARCNATGYVQAALLDADWREVAGFGRNESRFALAATRFIRRCAGRRRPTSPALTSRRCVSHSSSALVNCTRFGRAVLRLRARRESADKRAK